MNFNIAYSMVNILLWLGIRFMHGMALPAEVPFVALAIYLVLFCGFILLGDFAMSKMVICSVIVLGANWVFDNKHDLLIIILCLLSSAIFSILACHSLNQIKYNEKYKEGSLINQFIVAITQAMVITICLKF